MRKKKLLKNTLSSLVFQITTIVCGFITPKLILGFYGSEVNGLISSISQFMFVISFLELGVGAVVQSALYKPLAQKDNDQISKIIVSATKFFRNLAKILLAYIIVLIFVYPYFVKNDFGLLYTVTLLLSMSISYFAQYYFGVTERLLLSADQKGYIQYNAQTITLILNTIACMVLVELGVTIQVVKLTTSIIYLFRPIVLRIYVNRNYKINRRILYEQEPIQQKWNGVAQHLAGVLLNGTDTIVLTIFSTLSNVSIYTVYNLVVMGVKNLLNSATSGIQALMGDLWARGEKNELEKFFSTAEWCIHNIVVIAFGCTAVLIVPFVEVYTYGVNDAKYVVPVFAFLITIANALHCLRQPYHLLILAAGHYKQSQTSYLIAAAINIICSIVLVINLGLVGVAIGTLLSMTYQTIWMMIYVHNNLIDTSVASSLKQVIFDLVIFLVSYLITSKIEMETVTYFCWFKLALEVFTIWCVVSMAFNAAFCKDKIRQIIRNHF